MGIVKTALGALVAAAISTTSLAAEWRVYTYTSAAQPSFKMLERIAKEFGEASGGAFTFKLNVGGSLPIPAANITQAVGDGLIEIAGDGFYTSSIPIGGIAFLPMLLGTREEFAAGYRILEPYLAEALESRGVKLIGHYSYPLQTMFANAKVASLEDLKGRRTRVTSAEQAEFVRRLGANPVTIGTPEVASSLQRGLINVIFTASSGGARTYHEMLTHNYRLGPNFHLSLVTANLKKFNELSADHKQRLIAITKTATEEATAEYAVQEVKFTDEYRARGMVVTEPTDADKQRATDMLKGFWDDWAKKQGGKSEEAVKAIRAAIKK